EGLEYLKRAGELNPSDNWVKERMRLVEEEDKPEKGIEWREPLRKKNPGDLQNLTRLVELYEKLGQHDKAHECLKDALAANPKPPIGLVGLAARFFGTNKMRAEGEEVIRNYIASGSGVDKLDGLLLMGRFYEAAGDQAAALSAYLDA